MFDRLVVAAVGGVLAIGAVTLGASLITTPDNATGPCPATFDEVEAIDTFSDGLTQAQRSWGIAGAVPGKVRPGVIAAYAGDPANAPLSVITIDPGTDRQCRLVRFRSNHQVQGSGVTTLDWSPAGDALAIGFDDQESDGKHGQVLIWTPNRLFRVWTGDGTPGLEWAPDGRSVAIWKAWPLGDGPSEPPSETRVIHADGSPDRTYDIRPLADWLDWSPDGTRWLVIQGTTIDTQAPTFASIVDVADGRTTPIEVGVDHLAAMGWIDDGRVLLRDGQRGITPLRFLDVPVAAPAEFSILTVPNDSAGFALALSPDGRRVAYATAGGLAIADVAIGSVSPPVHVDIAGGVVDVGWPAWSPNGDQILFPGADAYWIVNVDGTGLRQLIRGNSLPFDDPWQPVPVP
jgi:WD40 repeat protein